MGLTTNLNWLAGFLNHQRYGKYPITLLYRVSLNVKWMFGISEPSTAIVLEDSGRYMIPT